MATRPLCGGRTSSLGENLPHYLLVLVLLLAIRQGGGEMVVPGGDSPLSGVFGNRS